MYFMGRTSTFPAPLNAARNFIVVVLQTVKSSQPFRFYDNSHGSPTIFVRYIQQSFKLFCKQSIYALFYDIDCSMGCHFLQ